MATTFAFIGFGEAGQHLSQGLQSEGAAVSAAYDIFSMRPTAAARAGCRARGVRKTRYPVGALTGNCCNRGQYRDFGSDHQTVGRGR